MKKYIYAPLILFAVLIFNNCDTNIDITNPDTLVIGSDPKTIQINIDPQSLKPETSPNYSILYSELKFNGCALTNLKHICPAILQYLYYPPEPQYKVNKEFNVVPNDSFKVKIYNRKINSKWIIDDGSIISTEPLFQWINNEVKSLRTEKTYNADGTVNYCFVFNSLKEGKGYISFIESTSGESEITCNESHGLLIGYTIKPLNKIILKIDEIKWRFNTTGFSNVTVKIKGTTNVYRLRGMTYGDGLPIAVEIPVKDDNSFEREYTVQFDFKEGVILRNNSQLILYGTVGLPIIVTLINPENSK